MLYAYIRVSTEKQTVENQRFEIQRFCASHQLEVNVWCEETVSGNAPPFETKTRKTPSPPQA